MKNKRKQQEAKRVSFDVIEAAKQGDSKAMNRILACYRPYITSLCRLDLYDASGRHYGCVDEEMMHDLEIKIMLTVLTKFDLV